MFDLSRYADRFGNHVLVGIVGIVVQRTFRAKTIDDLPPPRARDAYAGDVSFPALSPEWVLPRHYPADVTDGTSASPALSIGREADRGAAFPPVARYTDRRRTRSTSLSEPAAKKTDYDGRDILGR